MSQASKANLYQLRRALGLCVRCAQPARKDRSRCFDCLNDGAAAKRERMAKRREPLTAEQVFANKRKASLARWSRVRNQIEVQN